VKDSDNYDYEVIDGLQRWTISKELMLETIPCHVEDIDDVEVIYRQIHTNAVDVRTRDEDYAVAIADHMLEAGADVKEIAHLCCKSERWVKGILAIKALNPEIKNELDKAEVPISSQAELARLPTPAQRKLLDECKTQQICEFRETVREAKKDYKQFMYYERHCIISDRDTAPQPFLRTFREVATEFETKKGMEQVFERNDLKTPEDGWWAALKWVVHMDLNSREEWKRALTDARLKRKFCRVSLDPVEQRRLNACINDTISKLEEPPRERKRIGPDES
jgi:ParB-like chromosome segregation protein Spo0J